jgi:hypothetical protein
VCEFILSVIAVIRIFCQSRSDTALEVLALRQQVAVRKRKRPRPVLNSLDRLFWTTLRHLWSRWTEVLVIVKPETVITVRASGCTGVGAPRPAAVDPRSPRRSGG